MRKLLVITALILFAGIAFGQTLQKGAILYISNHTVELKPGVSLDQYMDAFLNKYIPEMEKLFPDTKSSIMKKGYGEMASDYMLVWFFPSEAVRDKYITPGFVIKDKAKAEKAFKLGEILDEYGADHGTGSNEWIVL
jgi:hypothetical protein